MSRQAVRDLKRALSNGLRPQAAEPATSLAKESALLLLHRSVHFGHGRLAVVRLAMAVQSGADVPTEHWRYCREAALASRDPRLRALLDRALEESTAPHLDPASTAVEIESGELPASPGTLREFNL